MNETFREEQYKKFKQNDRPVPFEEYDKDLPDNFLHSDVSMLLFNKFCECLNVNKSPTLLK
jgi:hypothetical protein